MHTKPFCPWQTTIQSFKKMKTSPFFLAPLIQAPHSPHQIRVCSLHCQENALCSMEHKKKFNDFYWYTGIIKGKHITNNCTELPLLSKASKCTHKSAQTPQKGKLQSSYSSIIFLTCQDNIPPSLKTKNQKALVSSATAVQLHHAQREF